MSKSLKILGLAGGGLLAFGGGAVGSHYAQPYLEAQFNPERKNNEVKLKQSLDEKSDEVISLGHDLNKQKKSNKSQENEIFKLSKDLKGLNEQVNEKQTQIEDRDRQIAEKTRSLEDKTKENQQQSTQIQVLQGNLETKTTELNDLNVEKTKVEGELRTIEDKLALKKEDILKPKALNFSALNIEVRKVEHKGFKNGMAEFEAEKKNGEKVTFKVKKDKDNFPDREDKSNYLKTTGLFLELDESFDSWDKRISLVIWEIGYESKATKDDEKRKFNVGKEVTEFQITDYFDSDHVKDAFRVLVAIGQLDNLPLCLEINSPKENLFNFCPDMKASQNFSSKDKWSWKEFKETDPSKSKLEIWNNRFKTKEGFLGYWFEKTVEFIRTGTVDFSNFLNPILLSKNYQES